MASEQATAAAEEIQAKFSLFNQHTTLGRQHLDDIAEIIDAAFAPVVAERDALLDKCRNLSSLGIAAMGYTFRGDEKNAKKQTTMIEAIQAEITAMIGEQA